MRYAPWIGRRRTRRAGGGLRSIPWFAAIVLVLLFGSAIFAPLLAPHSPTKIDLLNARIPPFEHATYPLGTDTLGRDVASRLVFGAQSAVVIVFVALGSAAIVGTLIGLLAGYYGGRVDTVLMRLVDLGLAFPPILAALVIAVFLGVGVLTVVVAVTVTMWAKFARMMRADVVSIRHRDFVTLATIAGVGTPLIIVRHILPNVTNRMLVVAALLTGEVILMEAALSFLGLGLPPGAPAWGIMVSEGRALLTEAWWLALFPGLAITAVVIASNLLGDWLRDALDPRRRGL